jgi:hypothetical protein
MQKKGLFGFLAGCSFGAALMYFGDPHRGAYRRAFVRDKGTHYRKLLGRKSAHFAKDVFFRTKGLIARTRGRIAAEPVPDDVLLARVSSRLGRAIWNPHRLGLEIVDGIVTVSGKVLSRELGVLIDAIEKTPGVRGVTDRLDIAKSASGDSSS